MSKHQDRIDQLHPPTHLTLDDEQRITKKTISETSPLFENRLWLWADMVVVILVVYVGDDDEKIEKNPYLDRSIFLLT